MTKTWIATFGGNHTHPLTGDSLRDSYCRVPGETYIAAHDLMIMSAFGRHWAFLYEHADLPSTSLSDDIVFDGTGRAAGVKRFGLVEVAFIPPSPVATALWAAYPKLHVAYPALWADEVVQPAEVAHLLAMARLGRNIEAEPSDDEPAEAEVAPPEVEPPPTGAVDLMAALRASIERAKAARAAEPEPGDAT